MAATSGEGVPVILHFIPAGTSHDDIDGHELKWNASKGFWDVKLSASQEQCAVCHLCSFVVHGNAPLRRVKCEYKDCSEIDALAFLCAYAGPAPIFNEVRPRCAARLDIHPSNRAKQCRLGHVNVDEPKQLDVQRFAGYICQKPTGV